MEKNKTTNLEKTILIDDDPKINASSRDPYLVIFIGKDRGRRHKLKHGIMTIGRSPEATITVEDDRISRIHCLIEWRGDTIMVKDQGSTNGTFVDSQRVSDAPLPPGVPFQIGHSVMKIEYKDEAEIRSEENLLQRACIDTLTGIFNREHFTELASIEMAYACRHRLSVGVIMIDIDNFKQVNDTHGHQMGDFVLAQFASVVCENTRTEDVFGRYGGEEFIIIPRGGVKKEDLYVQCERIRKAIENYEFCYNEKRVRITISLGFHFEKANNKNVDAALTKLINKADQALYRAKKKGKNRTMSLL